MVEAAAGGGSVSPRAGRRGGARRRNHALWEQYLISYADVAPSHVDWSVDQVEHVLSTRWSTSSSGAARGAAAHRGHRAKRRDGGAPMSAAFPVRHRARPVPDARGVLAAVGCGLLGNFLVLRRLSLMGDAISHSVLPGLVIAFLIASRGARW
jgi:hypothetical protein